MNYVKTMVYSKTGRIEVVENMLVGGALDSSQVTGSRAYIDAFKLVKVHIV